MLKKFTILSVLIIVLSSMATAQEMGFEEYNPHSTLVVPTNKVNQAKFPFIDIHSHQRDMSPEALERLVRDMD